MFSGQALLKEGGVVSTKGKKNCQIGIHPHTYKYIYIYIYIYRQSKVWHLKL